MSGIFNPWITALRLIDAYFHCRLQGGPVGLLLFITSYTSKSCPEFSIFG